MTELKGATSVDVTDAMSAAISAAMARIESMGSTATLIDLITKEEWKLWDASSEKALVCDASGLDEMDSEDNLSALAA